MTGCFRCDGLIQVVQVQARSSRWCSIASAPALAPAAARGPISWSVWSCVLKTLSTAVSSVAPAYDDRKEAYERKISTLVQRIASLLDGDPSDRRTGFDHMAFKVDTLMAVAFAIGLFIILLAPETHGEVLPP